jgi:hypothetical protein
MARQKKWNEYCLKIYDNISKFDISKANYALLGKYDDAIEITKLVIQEAKKVNDLQVIHDAENFIEEMEKKQNAAKELATDNS